MVSGEADIYGMGYECSIVDDDKWAEFHAIPRVFQAGSL
jgi:hypothetical protein